MVGVPKIPNANNQFYRLTLVSGSVGTGTYARGSRWNNLHNGENWDGRNCTAAMGAAAIEAHTGGRIKSSPPAIRNAQYDWSGGIGWDDVNVAWAKLFPGNQLILPGDYDWADTLAAVKAGRFVGIQGDNDQMGAWVCQTGGFTHAYGLAGFRSSDGRVLLYDPLCIKARWIPQYAIRLAAEKLALNERGSKLRLFVALTRPMAASAVWAAEISSTITSAYSAEAVASKLRSVGVTNYGSAINYIDLEAGLEARGINYGTSVQLIDVRALMSAGTGRIGGTRTMTDDQVKTPAPGEAEPTPEDPDEAKDAKDAKSEAEAEAPNE